MKYIKNLFLSLKEIFIVMIIQYMILIITILTIGVSKTIIIGTILIMIFELLYIVFKMRKKKIIIGSKAYFPYLLMGISISIIYNMIIFKIGIKFEVTDIPLIFSIISSGIIGPIFEEVLFRYSFINKLEKFNSKRNTIIISSIIFGIFHGNIVTIIYATIIGLINSYLYIKEKDIIIPCIIHVSANIIVNLLFNYNIWILLLGIILFIISILITKKNYKKTI